MTGIGPRGLILALVPLLVGSAASAEPSNPDPIIAKYADTSRAAQLPGGRRINIVCMGRSGMFGSHL